MLLEAPTLSNRLSVALLFGRLLIAVLFLYVGLSELHRLLFQPFTPYLPGDGHDVVWPKAVELILAVPFILGFQTVAVSRLLAASLVLEALYAWSW
jgi:alanyl-tRNA synthetase